MIKLLTCQTWVTEWKWFVYAQQHREQVPFLLADRSPCTDPFLDPYASSEERRPIISGLCRVLKHNLQRGNVYIYITRVDRNVCYDLGIPTVPRVAQRDKTKQADNKSKQRNISQVSMRKRGASWEAVEDVSRYVQSRMRRSFSLFTERKWHVGMPHRLSVSNARGNVADGPSPLYIR